MRPWLGVDRSLEALNRLAEDRQLRTESGKPVRFVPPGEKDAYYEIKVYETGRVETRPDNLHDFFNALIWLAFPGSKARINAMHAAEIPREGGKRGRLRDLLTVFDEGRHRRVRGPRADCAAGRNALERAVLGAAGERP